MLHSFLQLISARIKNLCGVFERNCKGLNKGKLEAGNQC